MTKPLIIAISGDTNSGKTTLLNAIIGRNGEQILKSASQANTALLTYVVPQFVDTPTGTMDGKKFNLRDDAEVKHFRKLAKTKNDKVRKLANEDEDGTDEDDKGMLVEILRVETPLRPSLGSLSSVPPNICCKLIDMPGGNELGNPHMLRCAEDGYSFSDVIVHLVSLHQTTAESTQTAFERLLQIAPYHFRPGETVSNFIMVITHMDQFKEDDDDDEEEEEEEAKAHRHPTNRLRNTLKHVDCLKRFPGFVENVPIVAISGEHPGKHDWDKFEEHLRRMVDTRSELIASRRARAGEVLHARIEALCLAGCLGGRYPENARMIDGVPREVKPERLEPQYERFRKRALYLGVAALCIGGAAGALWMYVGTTTTLVLVQAGMPGSPGTAAIAAGWLGLGDIITIPAIGLTASVAATPAVAAVPSVYATTTVVTNAGCLAMAGGGFSVATFLAAVADTVQSVLVKAGIISTTRGADIGATSAQEALRTLKPLTYEDVMGENRTYRDVQIHAEMKAGQRPGPLYIGEFLGPIPHGQGQLFWPNGVPAFKGIFVEGKMHTGFLLDDRDRVHGHYSFSEKGPLLEGYQPGDEQEDTCVICLERPPIGMTHSEVFRACSHSVVCHECLSCHGQGMDICPFCREPLSKSADGSVQTVRI